MQLKSGYTMNHIKWIAGVGHGFEPAHLMDHTIFGLQKNAQNPSLPWNKLESSI